MGVFLYFPWCVIPAEAGIHLQRWWIPASAGDDIQKYFC